MVANVSPVLTVETSSSSSEPIFANGQLDELAGDLYTSSPVSSSPGIVTEVETYFLKNLSHPITVLILILTIAIFLIKILIIARGVNTPWYDNVQGKQFINSTTGTITWIIAYFFSIVGIVYVIQTGRGPESFYLTTLFLLGLIIGFAWDLIFYYGRDIKFSLLLYLFLVLYYCWFFYEFYQYSGLAAFFQFFLLIRAIYFFVQLGFLFYYNPGDTIIPY
jgi:tryptophan-rich sensory protein